MYPIAHLYHISSDEPDWHLLASALQDHSDSEFGFYGQGGNGQEEGAYIQVTTIMKRI